MPDAEEVIDHSLYSLLMRWSALEPDRCKVISQREGLTLFELQMTIVNVPAKQPYVREIVEVAHDLPTSAQQIVAQALVAATVQAAIQSAIQAHDFRVDLANSFRVDLANSEHGRHVIIASKGNIAQSIRKTSRDAIVILTVYLELLERQLQESES